MALCSDCTENVHLKKRIRAKGIVGYCSVCRRQQLKVFDIKGLAARIGPVIKENFRKVRYESDDDYEYSPVPTQFGLEEIVIGILNQDIDFRDELVEALIEGQDYPGQDDEKGFFDWDALYSQKPIEIMHDYFAPRWNFIIDELKHHRRFFSGAVREFFDGIFEDVENITAFQTTPLKFQPVVREEMSGFRVYRGRIVDADEIDAILKDPFKYVGPTPKEKARTGRMSPEGVVALYCATEKDTALAELRPSIGQVSALIELRFAKTLRLLDFTRLERAIDDGWSALLHPWSSISFETRRFLRKLHNLISQPIVPGKEADYLITQTMAEYLAHVHQPGFDGIVFGSAQSAKGTNIVLFPKCDGIEGKETFQIEYVLGSLTLYRTEQVTYTHAEIIRDRQQSLWEDS